MAGRRLVVALSGRRVGLSGRRTVGSSGRRSSGRRAVGPSGRRLVGRWGHRAVGVWALQLSKVGVSRRRNTIFEKHVSFRVDETTSPSNRHRSKFRSQKKVVFRVDGTHFFFGGQVRAGTTFGKCQFYEAFLIAFPENVCFA